jgi:hypothetical protein
MATLVEKKHPAEVDGSWHFMSKSLKYSLFRVFHAVRRGFGLRLAICRTGQMPGTCSNRTYGRLPAITTT